MVKQAPFGSTDVIKNDKLDIITDVGDIEKVSNGIIKMIDNKEYARTSSAFLYNHVIAEFCTQNVVNKFEKIILNL